MPARLTAADRFCTVRSRTTRIPTEAMPRPISFDKHKVLDAATDLIWARGYDAASLSDLEAATGLSKSSLYNSFGSKRDVLMEVLDHYTASQTRTVGAQLSQKGLRTGLRVLVDDIITDNNDGRGCLLVNCAAELGFRDRRIGTEVRKRLDEIATVMSAAIERAQRSREVSSEQDAHILAQSLLSWIAGLRILAKAGSDPRALRQVAEHGLRTLLPRPRD